MTTKNRTSYTVVSADGDAFGDFARKDTAIRAGEKSGEPFYVETSSGKIVHDTRSAAEPTPEPTPEPIPEPDPTPEPEPTPAEEPKAKSRRKPLDIEKEKETIRMLLAKAESTEFEEERDTFNAAAEKKMLRLGLDMAELQAKGKVSPEDIIKETYPLTGIYARALVTFAADVSDGIGNVVVLVSNIGQRSRTLTIVGTRTDVEFFISMLNSLTTQMWGALDRYKKAHAGEQEILTKQEKFVQNRSFIQGFAISVRIRLRQEREEVFAEASTGAELVLASRKDKAAAWVSENMTITKGRRGRGADVDPFGYAAGSKAGTEANLGTRSEVTK